MSTDSGWRSCPVCPSLDPRLMADLSRLTPYHTCSPRSITREARVASGSSGTRRRQGNASDDARRTLTIF
jgi:hypothetical protein